MRRTAFKRRPSRTLAADRAWEAEVFRRDGHCTFPHDGRNCPCAGRLQAHHVIRREDRETRWDVDNGTLLCVHGHAYVHMNPDWSRAAGLIARRGDRVVMGRAFPS